MEIINAKKGELVQLKSISERLETFEREVAKEEENARWHTKRLLDELGKPYERVGVGAWTGLIKKRLHPETSTAVYRFANVNTLTACPTSLFSPADVLDLPAYVRSLLCFFLDEGTTPELRHAFECMNARLDHVIPPVSRH